VTTNKPAFYILIAITFLITAISFRTYFEFASYNLDDYYTFEFAPPGTSVLEAGRATTEYLYRGQSRYQPVRLYIFTAFTRLFDEAASPYYNFALHIVNILLLFLLLAKFGAGGVFSLISVLYFAVFGRNRFMDATSVMIGGSGLNLFFILLSFLFLIKSLEAEPGRTLRRYSFLGLSVLSYASLVFSYEVAIPLFVPLVLVFYLFSSGGREVAGPFRTKRTAFLIPYLIPLFVYIVFFRLFVNVSYPGAKVGLSLDILRRWKAYMLYTLTPPFLPQGVRAAEAVIIVLYFAAIVLTLKKTGCPDADIDKKKKGLRLLGFGGLFYFATVLPFALNSWLAPTSVMRHHTYLMTAAGGILLTSLFYNLGWVLPPRPRQAYLAALVVLVFPIIFIGSEGGLVRHYNDDAVQTAGIRHLKKGLQEGVRDIEGTDAIILKNFFYPYYGIRSMDGAFLKWFGFKKKIISGREIISARDGEITFKGPLHYYRELVEHRVRNSRARIFFMNPTDATPVPYHYFIDFKRGVNIYQTIAVKSDLKEGEIWDPYVLEAILANEEKSRYLGIWFTGRRELEGFMRGLKTLEINDKAVPRERVAPEGDHVIIDVSDTTDRIRYYFLKITFRDSGPRDGIRLIALTRKRL